MFNKKDFDMTTGGLSPLGWFKVLIGITLILIVAGVVILFYQDFSNVADDYYDTEFGKSSQYYVDSKAEFRRRIEFKISEQLANDSNASMEEFDSSNIKFGGMPLEFFFIQFAGEWGGGHPYQPFADEIPSNVPVPWTANVNWDDHTVVTGDGGIGPFQSTHGGVPLYVKGLYECDSDYYSELKQFVDDTSCYMNGGHSKYCSGLQELLAKYAKQDYYKFMNDSATSWLNHQDGNTSYINQFKAGTAQNGVDFDSLPVWAQAVVWAHGIRDGYNHISEMFTSTDPLQMCKEMAQWRLNKESSSAGRRRWTEEPQIAEMMMNGQIDVLDDNSLNQFSYHSSPCFGWWLENYSSMSGTNSSQNGNNQNNDGGNTQTGNTSSGNNQTGGTSGGNSQTGNTASTVVSNGDWSSWKQGGGSPWSGNMTLNSTKNNIAKTGCAVTSAAMMLNDMGITTDNPGQVNSRFKAVMTAGGDMQFEKIEEAYKNECPSGLVYERVNGRWNLNDAGGLSEVVNRIKTVKDAGKYVIIQLDYKNSDSGDHFVYCTGLENGKIKIADPGYSVDTLPDGYSSKSKCFVVSLRIFEKR